MTIYLDACADFCNPLSFCEQIVPGNFSWKALKAIHRMWWLKTRKQKLLEEKDKAELALKAFFQGIIVSNSLSTSAAQFIMVVVKSEETFTAYNEARKAWSAIGATWRGDYIIGKSSLSKRLIPTMKKVYAYFIASFCLVMTFIDVIDTALFSKKSSCEATLLIKNNLEKVHLYCQQRAEDLQRKLFENKQMLQLIISKANPKKDVDELIYEMVKSFKTIKAITQVTGNYIKPAISNMEIIRHISKVASISQEVIQLADWAKRSNRYFTLRRKKHPRVQNETNLSDIFTKPYTVLRAFS